MRMAIGTFDFVVGHMILMHELRGIFGCQNFRFVMALNAFSFRNMGVSLNDMDMASFAGDPSGNIFTVIETPALHVDIPFRFNMTGGAASHRTGKALLFPLWASFVIMTDEAIDLMNREMGSLDELSMAGGTAEFHPSSQFAQMLPMGEGHILVDHIPLKILCPVTAFLHTTGIADLSMRPARPLSGDEIGQGDLAVHPFPFEMVHKPGLIMAFLASHLAMAGGLPRLDIGVHLMAETAEGGRFRKAKKGDGDDEKSDDGDKEGYLHPPGMSLGKLFYRSKDIGPKGPG
jgi:hypothetical protein